MTRIEADVESTQSPSKLRRLLAPRTIATFGGAAAAEVIRQSRDIGYLGEIWPVHPRRNQIEDLGCYSSVAELPDAPDAAFIAVPKESVVPVVAELNSRGAGGAVCYTAGFAEHGEDGARLQRELRAAAGDMPVIGPNCIGVLNYLDGAALWPDQHGGNRVDRGVAILTQSGNIAQNLTMQRRSLPIAHVITAGNAAVTGIPELIEALLADPRVTAIGLHLEGIADVGAFASAALAAIRQGVPIVALKTGSSELGARTSLGHTSSLAGSDVLWDALFARLGIARVHEVSTFLETLKFLHVHGGLTGSRITTASCSGGEAALIADVAERYGAELPELPEPVTERLTEVLGPRVHVANPLDYHTFIWGDLDAQRACFAALFDAGVDAQLLILDFPDQARCDPANWEKTLTAFQQAREGAGMAACVVSSLPEGIPDQVREWLITEGIAPMQGMADAIRAITSAALIGKAQRGAAELRAPDPRPELAEGCSFDERAAKVALAEYGVPVPAGLVVRDREQAVHAAEELGYPVVAKALSADLAHKSEAGGVHIGLSSADAVRAAVTSMSGLGQRFLVERMVPDAVAELIVGVHRDPQFGLALTVGSGGVLVELLRDTATVLLPATRAELHAALTSLRCWPMLAGYRGRPAGDVAAVLDAIEAIAEYARTADVIELDVNPLLVRPEGSGAIAVDVLLNKAPDETRVAS
ncbi:acetate--CoA ligase family protein [Tamaricihabitans halophyticus]|uniref:acetate--CoA ligase family protein n=1 Tax=Tamaricihabitans halophyticus TaxID=1262583 RepID=UPI001FB541C8|nr:acetate--CoA ligase family protein [Tamaricihabitans halophyticus]